MVSEHLKAEPEFKIREFRYPQDYPPVIELWNTAGPGIHVRRSDQPDEILKKLQRDPDLFLVAESEGEIIGSVLGGFDGRRGMMYHLAVKAEYRRRGTRFQAGRRAGAPPAGQKAAFDITCWSRWTTPKQSAFTKTTAGSG